MRASGILRRKMLDAKTAMLLGGVKSSERQLVGGRCRGEATRKAPVWAEPHPAHSFAPPAPRFLLHPIVNQDNKKDKSNFLLQVGIK
jgi:hypothetical protein